LDRREFLAAAGTSGVAAILRLGNGSAMRGARTRAYVGFASPASLTGDSIGTFQIESGTWRECRGSMSHRDLSALALHPTLPVLYAAHAQAQHANLPRGSISLYHVDPVSGALAYSSTIPLALSATMPTHLAVAPDGQTLLASAAGGGSYNFFAVASDGTLLAHPHALKQTGNGPGPRQVASVPSAAVFDPAGRMAYATDLGTDRINHFVIEAGIPTLASRTLLAPGSGPANVILHPSGDFLMVSTELRPSLAIVPIAKSSGSLASPVQQISLDASYAGPVAVGAAGNHVYVALQRSPSDTWVLAYACSDRLRLMGQRQVARLGKPSQLVCFEDQLILAGKGGIAALPIDPGTGLPGRAALVVARTGAVGFALSGS
jgi:6-phosphogluconolactonase (cycloisomerase 2 family)